MNRCVYKNRLGAAGEEWATQYLRQIGCRQVARNFRFGRSEVDLIFCDDEKKILIFVEVKTRRSREFGEPEDAVTMAKRQSIKRAANGFLSNNPEYKDHEARIDVISIYIGGDGPEINHIINAFW